MFLKVVIQSLFWNLSRSTYQRRPIFSNFIFVNEKNKDYFISLLVYLSKSKFVQFKTEALKAVVPNLLQNMEYFKTKTKTLAVHFVPKQTLWNDNFRN
jgi:hypothetical protein